jgi:hypothetical protein
MATTPPPITSHLDITNAALAKMGQSPLTDFDVETKPARLARASYDSIRREHLVSHPWNFATRAYALIPGVLPTGEWRFEQAWVLPTGHLQVWAVESETQEEEDRWEVAEGVLITNLGSDTILNARVTIEVLDVSKYSAGFIGSLIEKLQFEWAETLVRATNYRDRLEVSSERKTAAAKTMDGHESVQARNHGWTWANAR